MQYRKKPVIIEAEQWDGDADKANRILGERYGTDWWYALQDSQAIRIPTLEGVMTTNLGDWIITGVQGEHYPCKPDIFEATYEAVQE